MSSSPPLEEEGLLSACSWIVAYAIILSLGFIDLISKHFTPVLIEFHLSEVKSCFYQLFKVI